MSKRVYEVARDLGMKGKDLASKINAMSLDFSVNNHMSTISTEQEDRLRRALEREQRENMVEEHITGTVIRRKRRRRKVAPTPTPAVAGPPQVEPTVPTAELPPLAIEAPPSVAEAPMPAEQPEPLAEPEPLVESEEPEVQLEAPTPAPEPLEVTPADGPMAEAAPIDTTPTAAESDEGVSAPGTEALEFEPPAPESEEPMPEALLERPEEAEVAADTEALPDEEPELISGYEEDEVEEDDQPKVDRSQVLAALARQQQSAAAARGGRSAAQVVGSLSPELLQQRLAVDKKVFGPPPKQAGRTPTGTRETYEQEQAGRSKRKRGKKVYRASELYDRRRGRRRAQKKSGGQSTKITVAAERKRVIKMEDAITVSDLAHQMGVKAGEVALKLMMDLGVRGANINTPLDVDTATLVADTYGYSVEQVGFDLEKYLPEVEEDDEDYSRRPPVVTVMGHVDHGKTSLLDAIRAANVAGGEAGGITQHIGAYKVNLDRGNQGTIVFLDTPGHEAFTALRARGAQATDIVVLVVAADDGVMPQTVEAINHAKDAEVPIVVAVNKIDKSGANTERVMQALTEYSLIPEEWGGETLFVPVSAKEHTGIDELLEAVLLQAELAELTANPTRPVEGIVIESRLDIGRGPVATVLIRQGTLQGGDIVVVGGHWGRVRAMLDDRGKSLKRATPSTPVEITGLDGVPEAGELLYGVGDEKAARAIADHISEQHRQRALARTAAVATDLETLKEVLEAGDIKELKVIIKADVQGSQEALVQALEKLSTEEVAVKIVHAAVGGITETDVNLAASSTGHAIIIGFNVRPETRAQQAADRLGVQIICHTIIYDVLDTIKKVMTGMLEPVFEEVYLGRAEVRDLFGIPKVGTVAGCYVVDGRVQRGASARILRNNRIVYESSIASLRRFKDDVREVKHGFECGISIENYNDIKLGDVIENYEINEVRPTLG
jgi:translation initiation factor IF-2